MDNQDSSAVEESLYEGKQEEERNEEEVQHQATGVLLEVCTDFLISSTFGKCNWSKHVMSLAFATSIHRLCCCFVFKWSSTRLLTLMTCFFLMICVIHCRKLFRTLSWSFWKPFCRVVCEQF